MSMAANVGVYVYEEEYISSFSVENISIITEKAIYLQ